MQLKRPRLIGGFVALMTLAAPGAQPAAQAAGDSDVVALQNTGVRRVTMGVGKSIIVDLPSDAGEIFVGNPKIANAVVRSARKIYVIGQDYGQTTIYAMDKQGRRIATLELSIGKDIGELEDLIRAALPMSKVKARTINDSIILSGDVESAGDMQTIMDIAKGFADNVNKDKRAGMVVNAMSLKGRDQVMIKVTIAEIQRSIAKQLGVTSATLAGSWGSLVQNNPFSVNGGPLSSGALTTLSKFGGGSSLSQTIQAFESQGVARTLAEPTLTSVSGEGATFLVGGQVPVSGGVICTATYCGPSVQFKSVGVTLNFTPVVLASGRVSLRLATEVAEVDPSTSATIAGEVVPGFRDRKHETTVELPSGGSIATAGLIQTSSNQSMAGLPGLMNLPILGSLFRSRDYQRQETELMIIVTPYVVKSTQATALARPTDNFTDASDPQSWLLGRVNKLYSTTDNPEAVQHFKGSVGFIHD